MGTYQLVNDLDEPDSVDRTAISAHDPQLMDTPQALDILPSNPEETGHHEEQLNIDQLEDVSPPVAVTAELIDADEVANPTETPDTDEVINQIEPIDADEIANPTEAPNVDEAADQAEVIDANEVVSETEAPNVDEVANLVEAIDINEAADQAEAIDANEAVSETEAPNVDEVANLVETIDAEEAVDQVEVIDAEEAVNPPEVIDANEIADQVEVIDADEAIDLLVSADTAELLAVSEVPLYEVDASWGYLPEIVPDWEQLPVDNALVWSDPMLPSDNNNIGTWEFSEPTFQTGTMRSLTTERNPFQMPGGSTGWIVTIAAISIIFVVVFSLTWRLLMQSTVHPQLMLTETSEAYPGGIVGVHGQGFSPAGTVTLTLENSSSGSSTVTVKTDGTFDSILTIPSDAQSLNTYTVRASEPVNQGTQATATAPLAVINEPIVQQSTPTVVQPTMVTYLPTATPTATPTPYIAPTPVYCVSTYPSTASFTVTHGAVAPSSITVGVVFCGSGTVVASASRGISVTPSTLTYAVVGTTASVVIKPAATIAPGTYTVTFVSVNGGNPTVLRVIVR